MRFSLGFEMMNFAPGDIGMIKLEPTASDNALELGCGKSWAILRAAQPI